MVLSYLGVGEMDWKGCKKNNMIKEVKLDRNLIKSLIESSGKKLKSQEMLKLSDTTASSKISLIYDSLRELLEALALSKGYKIYNHECYCAFLKEIQKESYLSDKFDGFRKIRNAINYYGKMVSVEEADDVIKEMSEFIQKIKNILKT